jgi:hypothetical protein
MPSLKTYKVTYFDEKNRTQYCYIQAKDSAEAQRLWKQQFPKGRFYSAHEEK